MVDSVILQSCFQLLPSKKLFEVRLTRKTLVYQQTSNTSCNPRKLPIFSVNLEDIYGAKVFRRNVKDDLNAYFHIFACPVKGNRRVCDKIRFKFGGWDDLDANLRLAERWVKTILWLSQDPDVDINTINDIKLPARRKILAFVNPFSGSGKSLKIFNNHVAQMFTDAAIDYTLFITEYAGHAEKVAMELNIKDWDGIVICSGDGLVYELINGLMKRSDWKTAIKMPLGVIPTGSGNALCYSALYASREPFDLTAAIYAVIRGQTLDLDICTIETPNQKIFSFLSLTWGIMSDVDIESEKYRYLGNARFTVGAVIRIFGLRLYKGRISYLPDDNGDDSNSVLQSSTSVNIPKEEYRDDVNDHSNFYSFPDSPNGFFFPGNRPIPEEKFQSLTSLENVGIANTACSSINDITSPKHYEGPQTLFLSPLNKKVPSNWKTVEGEFILGCSTMLSHLGPDLFVSPSAKFGDGILHIAYLKAGVSKLRLLSLFNEMETGGHLDSTECVYIQAKAFRLEPDLSQQGTIAVDGELIPYSVVQGEIHRGLGRIMCSRRYDSNT